LISSRPGYAGLTKLGLCLWFPSRNFLHFENLESQGPTEFLPPHTGWACLTGEAGISCILKTMKVRVLPEIYNRIPAKPVQPASPRLSRNFLHFENHESQGPHTCHTGPTGETLHHQGPAGSDKKFTTAYRLDWSCLRSRATLGGGGFNHANRESRARPVNLRLALLTAGRGQPC